MRILAIDIETAPNTAHVWGLFKQNVGINQLMESSYTLCFAAKWFDEDDILFASVYGDNAENMIALAWDLLDEADVVVHYNGDKFDIPTLNKEFLLYGYTPPSPCQQIDLLQAARKQFRFPSNKLDYIANALGLEGKVSHIGHELWVRCINEDPEAWKMMEEYNTRDVELLQEVYDKLLPWIKGHPNRALFNDTDRPACPNCGGTHLQRRGYQMTKVQKYKRYQCTDCGTWSRARFTSVDKDTRKNILTGT